MFQDQMCSNYSFEAHSEGRIYPAHGKKYNIYLKYNHFAAVCKCNSGRDVSGNKQPSTSHRNQRKHRIKRMTESDMVIEEDSSDEKFVTKSLAHMQIKTVRRTYGLQKTVPMMVNDIHIGAEPDKGADVTVMDEYNIELYNIDLNMTWNFIKAKQNHAQCRTNCQ